MSQNSAREVQNTRSVNDIELNLEPQPHVNQPPSVGTTAVKLPPRKRISQPVQAKINLASIMKKQPMSTIQEV